MKLIEEALFVLLRQSAELTALVDKRIYRTRAVEKAPFPHVVTHRLSTDPTHSHDGNSSLDSANFEFVAYATTPESAKNVAQAIRTHIDGYQGTIEHGVDKIFINSIFYEDEDDFWYDERDCAAVSMVFAVMWNPA